MWLYLWYGSRATKNAKTAKTAKTGWHQIFAPFAAFAFVVGERVHAVVNRLCMVVKKCLCRS
jgi:hypothetical protein